VESLAGLWAITTTPDNEKDEHRMEELDKVSDTKRFCFVLQP